MKRTAVFILATILVPIWAPTAAADEYTFNVFATDGGDRYWFSVEDLAGENPTLSLESGDQVTVNITNTGSQPHNIHFGSPVARGSDYLMPGSSQNFTFTVPGGTEPQQIEYWCDPHRQFGMVGTILLAGEDANASDADASQERLPPFSAAVGVAALLGVAAHIRRRRGG